MSAVLRLPLTPMKSKALTSLLLVAVCMSAMDPGRAQDRVEPTLSSTAPEISGIGNKTSLRYHLPISNNHSLYFLPGSSDLNESARSNIAAAARRLKAIPTLRASLVAYTDALEDSEYGDKLRRARAMTVSDALAVRGGVKFG